MHMDIKLVITQLLFKTYAIKCYIIISYDAYYACDKNLTLYVDKSIEKNLFSQLLSDYSSNNPTNWQEQIFYIIGLIIVELIAISFLRYKTHSMLEKFDTSKMFFHESNVDNISNSVFNN